MTVLTDLGIDALEALLKVAALVPSPIQPEAVALSAAMPTLVQVAPEIADAAEKLWKAVKPVIASGQAPTADHVAQAQVITAEWDVQVSQGF